MKPPLVAEHVFCGECGGRMHPEIGHAFGVSYLLVWWRCEECGGRTAAIPISVGLLWRLVDRAKRWLG